MIGVTYFGVVFSLKNAFLHREIDIMCDAALEWLHYQLESFLGHPESKRAVLQHACMQLEVYNTLPSCTMLHLQMEMHHLSLLPPFVEFSIMIRRITRVNLAL